MPKLDDQLTIESLIAAPLVAASKANVLMLRGQTKALLDNCFLKNQDGTYEPIMINMTLTKASLHTKTSSPDTEIIKPASLTFSVPLICLVPINNIAVDKINLDFDMEITTIASRKQKALLSGLDPVVDDRAILFGKISTKPSNARNREETRESSHLRLNIDAGPLPLPLGLLTILDLYSKAIQPVSPKTSTASGITT